MIADQESINTGPISKKQDVFAEYSPETKVRTKKMMMWFIIFAIVMIFAGFTSGYIVKSAGEFWVHIEVPTMLYVSLCWLVASSITIFLALRTMKKGRKSLAATMMILTFIGGLGFSVAQYLGWESLADKGMGFQVSMTEEQGGYGGDYAVTKNDKTLLFDGKDYYLSSDELKANPVTDKVRQQSNISASFIFVLIIVHIVHLALGLIYILVNTVRILKNRITREDTVRLYTNGMYWHFMGILWVYLFIFLFFIH
jgi:cytochrome c oxidase subunit 3